MSYVVYEANRTIQFPKWDDAVGHAPLLPVAVTETDDGGRVLRRYTVRVDVELGDAWNPSTNEPVGLNALTQDDYVTLTTYVYDAVTGQQAQTRRYHDIPSSGDGVLGTHYDATIVQYDLLGRRETTIRTVSGSDPATDGKEQVTQVVYENGFLDRVVETRSGVSDAGHTMEADYGVLPTLYTLSQSTYDHGGVGDGHMTQSLAFYGEGANDYTGANYYRDFRGRSRGS